MDQDMEEEVMGGENAGALLRGEWRCWRDKWRTQQRSAGAQQLPWPKQATCPLALVQPRKQSAFDPFTASTTMPLACVSAAHQPPLCSRLLCHHRKPGPLHTG